MTTIKRLEFTTNNGGRVGATKTNLNSVAAELRLSEEEEQVGR